MKFNFTKTEFQRIVDECMLSEEQIEIFEMLIRDKSIIQISMKLNISVSAVNYKIKKLKQKIERVL